MPQRVMAKRSQYELQVQAMQRLQGLVRNRLLTWKERQMIDRACRDMIIAQEFMRMIEGNDLPTALPRVDLVLQDLVGRIFRPGGNWVVIRLLRELR